MASPLKRSISEFAIFFALISILIISTAATVDSSRTASYTSGVVDEKCVLEEEFHGASSLSLGSDDDGAAWWDDDDSDDSLGEESTLESRNIHHNTAKRRKHRWRVWKNRGSKIESSSDVIQDSGAAPITTLSTLEEEHPMRTDEWELDVQLSRLFSKDEQDLFPECSMGTEGKIRCKQRYRKRQVMKFARNGYVKVMQDEQLTSNNKDATFVSTLSTAETSKRGHVQIGKWKVGPGGVVFDIPVNFDEDNVPGGKKMTVLHYHADIHLNKFGERPRMFRGVITRDRLVSIVNFSSFCSQWIVFDIASFL